MTKFRLTIMRSKPVGGDSPPCGALCAGASHRADRSGLRPPNDQQK